MKVKVFFFCLLPIILISCNSKNMKLSSIDIINKSIEKHGGIKKWKTIKELSFDKKTVLFSKNGNIEKTIEQHQSFIFSPNLSGEIISKSGEGILFNGKVFKKIVKDSTINFIDKSTLEKAKNQFYAAEYVVCQPFKLNDKNIILSDNSIETVNNIKAYAIGVTYKNDTSLSDKWIYYFDKKTFQLIATKVIHLDRDSMIENLSFDTSTGFIFNKERKSFITDKKTNEKYIRAKYFYTNFNIVY